MANFGSTYARLGNETDLHAIQQRLGESLCSFIHWFSQVCSTIPRISNASVVVAFRQGVRDEKMLEKLTTHDIQDGAPCRQREGKQRVNPQEEKDVEIEFRDARRALKAVYGHSDSESSDNECHKALHIMFRGFWDITSRRNIKTLHQEIAAATPTPKAAPHHKWVETLTRFDASNCPKSIVGAGQLPLLVSPTIANIKLYHVLIDGGVTLNLISVASFKKLQIPMGKL
jgi:hypothetical protein